MSNEIIEASIGKDIESSTREKRLQGEFPTRGMLINEAKDQSARQKYRIKQLLFPEVYIHKTIKR
jgi:hypothetical protein